MAYRRRQGIARASTFKEEIFHNDTNDNDAAKSNSTSSSLAARAIRASAAHRDSSGYGYAYAGEAGDSSSPSSLFNRNPDPRSKGPDPFESASMEHPNESKYGFWSVLARKAKSILEEENENQYSEAPSRITTQANNSSNKGQFYVPGQLSEGAGRIDNVRLKKGLDKITTSLNHIGDTIGNALEEGRTIVENKTADIIQETRKLQIGRKGTSPDLQYQGLGFQTSWQKPSIQPSQMPILSNQETQLKASRDVAMATAAKAKLLLRELKTVKADLAFAKERCAQLEEENKRLRESRGKGDNPADDDLIRLQLETLLAEKARLAHENSIYARENRFLREIVEYHQLTMQDVVYLDEGTEEVTEVYPFSIDDARVLSTTPTSPTSPSSLLSDISLPSSLSETKELKSGLPRVPSKNQISSSSSGAPSETCPGFAPSRKEATGIPSMLQEPASVQEGSRPPETVLDDPERASNSSG